VASPAAKCLRETPQLIKLRHKVVPLGQHLESAAIDGFTGDGQHAAMTDTIEQRYADLIFEMFDRLAHSRLRCEHGLGGLREATLPDDLHEGAECS
jgi:hypothetical protein